MRWAVCERKSSEYPANPSIPPYKSVDKQIRETVNMAVATINLSEYRTQKVRGISALSENGFNTPQFEVYGVEKFADTDPYELLNRFVRPCPLRPRHGFVDSRPINTLEEARQIVAETFAEEPDAEILTMPFIIATHSAVWTDGILVIGTGHDGATAGRDSRTIPVVGIPIRDEYRWGRAKKDACITEAPYVELLWEHCGMSNKTHRNYFVQLRDGVKAPTTTDYIPFVMEVQNVIEAGGDLLAWESSIKNVPEGTVVWHPGGSLASHYAVHSVLNGVPVVISRQPVVGETLEPNTEVPQPDILKMRAGFFLGATTNMTYLQAAYVMLSACHSTSVWLGKRDELLGFGLGCMYRLIVTAALGEMRHHPRRRFKPDRNTVYQGVWDKMLLPATRTRFIAAMESFSSDEWRGNIGGDAWYRFSLFAAGIFNALVDGDVRAALETMNKGINAAHNTGWGFNKFLDHSNLDEAAENPCSIVLRCAPELYNAIRTAEEFGECATWFKRRRHIELDEQDLAGAMQQIETEEEDAEEVPTCENCENTNPYCENCGSESVCGSCCDCQKGSDTEPEAHPDDCPCYDCVGEGAISTAQAVLRENGVLHVQYKHENGGNKPYLTKNIFTSETQRMELFAIFSGASEEEKVCSLAGSGTKYLKFIQSFSYPNIWILSSRRTNHVFTVRLT